MSAGNSRRQRVSRFRIAAFNTSTGALTSFAPSVGGTVNGLAVSDTTVFIGGASARSTGSERIAVGAVARSNGATTAFNPILPGGRDVQKLSFPRRRQVVIGATLRRSTAHPTRATDWPCSNRLPGAPCRCR